MSLNPDKEGTIRNNVRNLCLEVTQLLKANARWIVKRPSDPNDLGMPFDDLNKAAEYYSTLIAEGIDARIDVAVGYLELNGKVFRPAGSPLASSAAAERGVDQIRYQNRRFMRDLIMATVLNLCDGYNMEEIRLASTVMKELLIPPGSELSGSY